MAQVFRLPRIGDSMAEITIQEWRVAVGDTIAADDVICDAETTKTVVEVPCPYAGTVLHLGGDVGDVIELDEILIVIGEEGESWSPGDEPGGAKAEEAATAAAAPAAAAAPTGAAGGPIKATPKVRKLAKELGVDLSQVTPTGPNGSISEDDVQGAAAGGSDDGSGISIPHERVKMSMLRKSIGANLIRSATEVPHAAVFWDMDLSYIVEQRKALIEEIGE